VQLLQEHTLFDDLAAFEQLGTVLGAVVTSTSGLLDSAAKVLLRLSPHPLRNLSAHAPRFQIGLAKMYAPVAA
jgi:hypothetical protein